MTGRVLIFLAGAATCIAVSFVLGQWQERQKRGNHRFYAECPEVDCGYKVETWSKAELLSAVGSHALVDKHVMLGEI